MKVCMILNKPFIHDSRVYREAKALVDNGFKVILYATKDSRLAEFENRDGIIVKNILPGVLPTIPCNNLEFTFGIKGYKLFLNDAQREKFDVFHCHDQDTLLMGILASKQNKAKVVYDSHEYWAKISPIFKSPITNSWESLAIKKADKVITVNDFIAERLAELYNIPMPLTLLNCPEYSRPSDKDLIRKKLGTKKKIVLFLGIFREIENLIKASSSFGDKAVLVLMGFDQNDYWHNYVHRLGLSEYVKILPPVPSGEVVDYTSTADIGVALRYNLDECFYLSLPNKFLETVVAGIPVVSSNFPVMQHYVDKYHIGLTFNPESDESIASAINRLLDDQEFYNKCKVNAQWTAENEINWQIEGRKLVSLYENL